MANKLQKFLFTASALSPLLICAAGVHWYNVGLTSAVVFIGILGLLLSLYAPLSVFFFKKLPPTKVTIENTDEVDREHLLKFTFVWLSPLVGIILKGEYIWVFVTIGLICAGLLSLSNTCIPNLYFILMGYHYHKVKTTTNDKQRYMLSKRGSISDRSSVRKVVTVFNDLWIEVL